MGWLLGAVAGGVLANLLYLLAVFLVGFGFGAVLALLLLANVDPVASGLGSLVAGVVTGLVALKLQRVAVVMSTAVVGAFRSLMALMYFTHGLDWLYYYRAPEQLPALVEANAWLLPATLVLAGLGAIAQFEETGRRPEKKRD